MAASIMWEPPRMTRSQSRGTRPDRYEVPFVIVNVPPPAKRSIVGSEELSESRSTATVTSRLTETVSALYVFVPESVQSPVRASLSVNGS